MLTFLSAPAFRRQNNGTPVGARGADHVARNAQVQGLSYLNRVAAMASSYFTSAAIDEQNVGPFVDLVRMDASVALRYIRIILGFTLITNVIVCGSIATFLWLYWTSCGFCDKPMRWWLFVHAVLQLVQLPVRIVFVAKIRNAHHTNVEYIVSIFTSSPAWRTSVNISMGAYGWFVLGIVWLVNSGHSPACTKVYWVMVAVILSVFARGAAAMIAYRALFSNIHATQGIPPMPVGAEPDLISSMPLVTFSRNSCSDDDCCAVCLCDYKPGASLRKLPCGHHFHRRCVDKWLRQNKRCPLCMQAIDSDCKRQSFIGKEW